MTKVVHCRDIGFDCNAVVRAEREEAALQIVPTTQKRCTTWKP
jgi:predicted small metal-binding protein